LIIGALIGGLAKYTGEKATDAVKEKMTEIFG